MKKLLSLGLVAAMAVSAMPMAYATTDVSNGTEVEYIGSKTTIDGEGNEVYAEAYTVTVPAKMAPGGAAFVKAEGTWNSARKLVVTADKTVELENNINTSDKKTLDVTFNGINLVGNNNVAVANYGDGVEGEAIAVGNIENALFGTWSGVFEYQAEIVDNVELINFVVDTTNWAATERYATYQAEEGMTWEQWIKSDYNIDGWYVPEGSTTITARIPSSPYPYPEHGLRTGTATENNGYWEYDGDLVTIDMVISSNEQYCIINCA